MKRKDVIKAAEVLKAADGARALRATLKGGKHELRLYGLTEKDTIEDEIEVPDSALAELILNQIIADLDERLKQLGVN